MTAKASNQEKIRVEQFCKLTKRHEFVKNWAKRTYKEEVKTLKQWGEEFKKKGLK